jgi:hypothetical protein
MSEVLATERIGQLTGSTRTRDSPGLTTDWTYWPLLNETSRWGVVGLDLGANTEHNERLYFFFGDAYVEFVRDGHLEVAADTHPDPVCWTTDTVVQRHGGHLALGWDFKPPNDHQGATPATGQRDWRFCEKCHGIFFCPGQQDVGVCPAGGAHTPLGWNFVLPNDHQGAVDATGQRGWRPCDRCAGLFFAPNGDASRTVCPAGGPHRVPAGSWDFFLPAKETGATDADGQPHWRFCANCHSLYWDGDSIKGVCPAARGGGIRLNGVLDQTGRFAAFCVDPPIGILGENETPTGAFSHAGRAYVFVWVASRAPHDVTNAPRAGSYLTSKADPSAPGNYRVEQLISPLMISPLTARTTGFYQIAPVKVDATEFAGLFPDSTGAGVVLFGHGHNEKLGHDGIHLAWSPLAPNPALGPLSLWYYTGESDPDRRWSRDANDAEPLLSRPDYTSVSATWRADLRRWILIYGTANPTVKGGPEDGPVMARLARTPFDLATAEDLPIFHPAREHAYTNYMHWPGKDCIHPELPPSQPPPEDYPGWAYGAHLLNRYTRWDPRTGLIDLYYLLSTASPYQVHLMHTTIRFT